MSVPFVGGSRQRGALLLADITGYTAFLQGVAEAHRALIVDADEPPAAYAVLSHLLDTMVSSIAPTFRLAKFEGDAIFAVAVEDMPAGPAVLDCLRACYASFRERLAAAGSEWTCTCSACALGGLDLKFVLHHGDYVVQSIAGREELLGPDINIVHRLLKNHVRELIGPRPYALVTDAAAAGARHPDRRHGRRRGDLRRHAANPGARPRARVAPSPLVARTPARRVSFPRGL